MKAKKYFGQNFITDKNLILKIISLLKNDGNTLVVEIGPGRGALTCELVKQFKKVIAIEIDTELEEVLKNKIPDNNFELIIGDVLEIDLNKIFSNNKNFSNIVLISNTPYYITSEILFKTFKSSEFLSNAVFMFQKEVAERICAKVNENNYNNLSIVSEFYSKPKYEFTVKKNMFNPIPKVDSSIVSLDFSINYKHLIDNEEDFVAFVRKLFNNKRKTILNNLKSTIDNIDYLNVLKSVEINYMDRPENISLQQFINLYNKTKKA